MAITKSIWNYFNPDHARGVTFFNLTFKLYFKGKTTTTTKEETSQKHSIVGSQTKKKTTE